MKSGPLEASEAKMEVLSTEGVKIAVSVLDFVLRIVAIIGTLGSSIAMGTASQTLPFTSQFIQRAQYNDFPTLTFFVVANSIVCAYLAFSLLISVFHIIWNGSNLSRIILIMLDMAMLTLLIAGASAATAIVNLAHKGNSDANWSAICPQFDLFCERMTGSLIGSFGSAIVFIFLILLSAISLSRR